MKKIKFCGKSIDSDKIIFSDSIEFEKIDGLDDKQPYLKNNDGDWVRCNPDSIKQFMGYDGDGNEVYERDMLADNYGEVFTAYGSVTLENENLCTVVSDMGDTIFGYRLK